MRVASLVVALAVVVFPASPAGAGPEPEPEPEHKLVTQTPPALAVNSVAVSPDGSVVATASGEGGVRLYDARTGAMLRALGDVGDRCVVFSRDGRTLAAAGFHMDKLAALVDVRSGDRVRTFVGHAEWETDATAVSPDGRLLASSGVDKQVLVWEAARGNLLLRIDGLPGRVPALAFSPDGTTIAGGGEGEVRLWDTSNGRLRRTLRGHGGWVCTLAFSPDGARVAGGGSDWGFHRGHDWPRPAGRGAEQCEWRLWDVGSGEALRTVKQAGRMLSLALAPDGRSLACGVGTQVRVYDLTAGVHDAADDAPHRVIATHDGDVTSVAFVPDGTAVVSGGHDQVVKRSDVATGAAAWRAPGWFEQVNAVALSADGAVLATGSGDQRFARGRVQAGAAHVGPGAVRLWDARTGRMLRRLGDPADQVMAVSLSADGRRVVAGCGTGAGGAVRAWDASTGTRLWSHDRTSAGGAAAEVLSVAFTRDASAVACGAADGTVEVRDAADGRVTRTLGGHRGGATAVAFSPDGAVLYCAEAFGGVRVWDMGAGKLLRAHPAASAAAESFTIDRLLHSIGLRADGRILASCASSVNNEYTDPVRLWDARDGTLRRSFADENIHGRPMALSPDGTVIATGGKSVKLWDAGSGKLLRELDGLLKRTQSIGFSADGRLVVAGGSYGTTNVWEAATGRHLVTLFAFPGERGAADEWLAYQLDGSFDGSEDVGRFLAWRVGDEFKTFDEARRGFGRRDPERVKAALGLLGEEGD